MPTPGIHPRESPRNTPSTAEQTVWRALRDHLPAHWHAWHSLRLRDKHNLDGEGDFVLAAPNRGLLVLEVKGGHVELRDGRWFQNGHPMKKAPREQGLHFAHRLVDRLHKEGCAPPAFGVATCFPDVAFEHGPSQADMVGAVLGRQDLDWLADALPALIERALPSARNPKGRWIEKLHALWGETWTPRLRLGQKAEYDEAERLALDATQLALLDCIYDNDRMLVSGVAGSGKTVLAAELARRWSAEGQRVLYVCYTKALARWLASALSGTDVHVAPVREYAHQLLAATGQPINEAGEGFWDDLPWRAAELVDENTWDAVLVDEGQDLSLGDWSLVEKCAGKGPLWAFQDDAQAFWDEREVPRDLFTATFQLPKNYRCPSALFRVAQLFAGKEDDAAVVDALSSGELAIVACPSESSVAEKIATEIDKLLGEGLAPSDIAIVSLRGQSAAESVIRQSKLGRHELVPADDPAMSEHVVADTFLRFKGLERPAVIVTDLRLVADKQDKRLHIALTRALATARVVAPREVLRAVGPLAVSSG